MIPNSVTFQDQMQMSEGASGKKDIKESLLSCFPTAIAVERANTSEDKNGTDYWVEIISGQKYSVDVKVRSKDYSKDRPDKDDLALETWSVIGKKIGWTRDINKRTDYIFWLWRDTGRWMLIPFPLLCGVFGERWEEWRIKYRPFTQYTDNLNGSQWKSECVFVPRLVVWREIYDAFGGAPARKVNPYISDVEGLERAKHRPYANPKQEGLA